MPAYAFQDTKTGEEFEAIMSFAEREEFLSKNPHVKHLFVGINIVSSVEGQNKTSGAFKEVLEKVAEAHPNSPLAEKYGRKSNKEIKTQEAVKKWRKKYKMNYT